MLTPIENTDVDTAEAYLATLTYYPIYTHPEHGLSKDWVKIPASLLRKLHVPPGWEASHPCIDSYGTAPANTAASFPLYHYLNHPLPYVQVCGMVIDITYSSWQRAWIVQLDDSSGYLVDVSVKKYIDPNEPKQRTYKSGTAPSGKEPQRQPLQGGDIIPMYVLDWFGCSWTGKSIFDIRPIEIGSILRAKGRLCPWMKGRQLRLERFDIFRSTSQEITFWNDMTEDFNTVLRKPWTLTVEKQEQLRLKFEAAKIQREKQMRKQVKKARKHEKLKELGEEVLESKTDQEGLHHPPKDSEKSKMELRPIAEDSSELHPVKAGLAPSYQIPPAETNLVSGSSGDDPYTSKAAATAAAESSADSGERNSVVGHATKAVFDSSESTGSAHADHFPSSTDAKSATVLIDMGSPSQWDNLQLNDVKKPQLISTGSEWLDIRTDMSSRHSAVNVKDRASFDKNRATPSVEQQWDELDI